ncbi:alcohol dehydrogenase family protein [Ruegeria sp. R14_0]|uniref:alcohol dehydrogenase family protein n=1 Tax=Ruegeria sp. R14_0 TaxID=2821100 RepID=UPI001ADC1613|nr:alcohol dehydrogenase family protein [Ruegeria sp. R14_0]MBO9447724.1 alcohol dehydrogenase family protein [Ruegeria sp. R14_0]
MTIPTTMAGVYLTRHGGPEVLEWRDDIPVPTPGAGQVLVRVAAAGVNNTDINTRIGWYSSDVTGATDDVDQDVDAGGWGGALAFPRIQGGDLCGIVELAGPETGFKVGQRVTCPINLPRPRPGSPTGFIALGSEVDGAFAQYCLVEADDLYDVTTSPLSDVEIAAIPCAFGTAENLLTRAGVTSGQKVLITGASGGVGLAAVQLAALRGASVWGVTSPAKADVVKAQGASGTYDRNAPLPNDMFDVVIDVVGGPAWPGLILALKPGGHYAVSGAIAGPIVEADLRDIYLRDITIHGCTHQAFDVFGRLVEMMNSGRIKPLVSKTYPLRDIAKAQEDFQSKALPGKLVLVP